MWPERLGPSHKTAPLGVCLACQGMGVPDRAPTQAGEAQGDGSGAPVIDAYGQGITPRAARAFLKKHG